MNEQFEYKILAVIDPLDTVQELNKAGLEGWEAYAIVYANGQLASLHMLKRRIEETLESKRKREEIERWTIFERDGMRGLNEEEIEELFSTEDWRR